MAGDDRSAHWLWRLDADAWLRAAEAELAAGHANLHGRRTAVTHARRAAGMAINAVLVALAVAPDDELRWGRSYLDHLRALASADPTGRHPLPDRVQALASGLMTIAVVPAADGLVQLGRGPDSAAQQALDTARALVDACAATIVDLGARA